MPLRYFCRETSIRSFRSGSRPPWRNFFGFGGGWMEWGMYWECAADAGGLGIGKGRREVSRTGKLG